MATISYGTFTIVNELDGSQFWTTTVEPVSPDYTFTISDLVGDTNADIKVGDVILYSHYRYTVTAINDNGTVLGGNRESLRGVDGISPTVKSIVSSHVTAVCEKDGTYNPTSILFSGKAQYEETITDYYGWFVVEISPDGTNWVKSYETDASKSEASINYKIPLGVTITKDGIVYSYNETNITTNGSVVDSAFTISPDGVITTSKDIGFIIRSIRCTLYSSADKKETEVVDQQRVSIVFDGVDGESGDDGYTVVLTNENHTFSGNTTSAVKASTECEVVAYIGKERVACHIGEITGHPNGMQTEIINNDTNVAKFKISVDTNMTSQNGVLHIPVTVDDKLFDMIFTYSLKLNGLDATGLGWMVNYSAPTTPNNGECIYYGFDEVTKKPSFEKDGWVLWNGQEVTIPHGCYINPDDTMPYNTTIYSVYRLSTATTFTNGTFHDVAWVEGTNSWKSNTYSGVTAKLDTAPWVWNEDTDIILAMYTEPSSEGTITNAQLFTPPKKYSELVEVAKGMAKDASKTATNYIATYNPSGSTGGIYIHRQGDTDEPTGSNANGILITDKVDIIRNGISAAEYGTDVRVGRENESHIVLSNTGMSAYSAQSQDGDSNLYYQVGDGTTEGHQTYVVPEQSLIIELTNPIEEVFSVTDGGVELVDITNYLWNTGDEFITLNYIPSEGNQVSIEYSYLDADNENIITTIESYTVVSSDRPSMVIQLDKEATNPIVKIDGNVVEAVFDSKNGTVTIGFRPANTVIVIEYTITKKPYFTFNNRKANSLVGNGSVVMGDNGEASGANSFAGGIDCEATQEASVAFGKGVVVASQNGFGCGSYNANNSNVLFSVGNGTNDTSRSDALWVGKTGNLGITGTLYSGQPSGSSKIKMFATGQKKLDNISINANSSSGTKKINLSKKGYIPVAIRGIRINNATSDGSGCSYCNAYAWSLSGSNLVISIYNSRNSTSKIKIIVDVFYIAKSAF